MIEEKVVDVKECNFCLKKFNIMDKDIEFLNILSPTISGKKIKLPHPGICPECCKIHRFLWRNEKNIYKRKCDATGKDIIAIFSPISKNKIYQEDYWNSDKWDAKKYGMSIDFFRPFFEQFKELLEKVPLASKATRDCENSDYCNGVTNLKNCYLVFSAMQCEDCYYSVDIVNTNNSIDMFNCIGCNECYECIVATDCNKVKYSYNIKRCIDSEFLLSCEDCNNCYGCFDLLNKKYCIYNIQYTKEEYELEIQKIKKLNINKQQKIFESKYLNKYINKPLPNIGSENVIESENIINSQNISYSKHIRGAQNARYCQKIPVPSSNYTMFYNSFGGNVDRIYFSQQIGNNAKDIYFSVGVFNEVSNIYYSCYCRNNVSNLFGCVGLIQGEKYCILNKQYTKEEYEILVFKLIEHMKQTGEWGQFFPAYLSPHGYNETITKIYSQLTKKEAEKKGYNWSNYETPLPKVDKIIPANKIPDNILDIPDDILNWAIECEITKKLFKIIKQELDFYRKHNLPIPKKHPDQRYLERTKWHFNY